MLSEGCVTSKSNSKRTTFALVTDILQALALAHSWSAKRNLEQQQAQDVLAGELRQLSLGEACLLIYLFRCDSIVPCSTDPTSQHLRLPKSSHSDKHRLCSNTRHSASLAHLRQQISVATHHLLHRSPHIHHPNRPGARIYHPILS